jgi:hypothetical protein
MNKNNIKMNAKNILVSVLLIASILFSAVAVSAYSTSADYSNLIVKINGDTVDDATELPALTVGDTVTVQVKFTSVAVEDSIKIKATLEGEDDDVVVTTSAFDVEEGENYVKTLTLKVPSELDDDETSADFALTLEIGDDEIELGDLHVQRESYNVAIKSILTSSTLSSGASVPVQIVLENDGYNDLDDLYVTVSIAELGIQKQVYFGDLVNVEYVCSGDCDDEENSVVGTVYLDVPYNAKSGVYTLSVEVSSDDSKNTATKQVTIENSVSDIVMKSGNSLVLLNPTSKLAVYKVNYEGNSVAVVIPAQSSQTVPIEVPVSGDYKFDVSVFSGDTLLSTVNFEGTSEATQTTSPVLVLTIILAIVFLVLLVVLVVLITKKPQKAEEFGESYY